MYHELFTMSASTTAAATTTPAITPSEPRMACFLARLRCSSRPSLTTSTTMTETLSCPPATSAALTSWSVQSMGEAVETAMVSMPLSGTIEERPSEQMIMRSPRSMSSEKWSAYMSGSEPSARVMMERDGWTRASSAVISPASTSSST